MNSCNDFKCPHLNQLTVKLESQKFNKHFAQVKKPLVQSRTSRNRETKLANLKDRYSTFGLESGSSKFTSKWELVLVLLVITAGIVITSMAALKAKEKSSFFKHRETSLNQVQLTSKSLDNSNNDFGELKENLFDVEKGDETSRVEENNLSKNIRRQGTEQDLLTTLASVIESQFSRNQLKKQVHLLESDKQLRKQRNPLSEKSLSKIVSTSPYTILLQEHVHLPTEITHNLNKPVFKSIENYSKENLTLQGNNENSPTTIFHHLDVRLNHNRRSSPYQPMSKKFHLQSKSDSVEKNKVKYGWPLKDTPPQTFQGPPLPETAPTHLIHDGLPGFPPPSDFIQKDEPISRATSHLRNISSSESNQLGVWNIELAADGAGFIQPSDDGSTHRSKLENDQLESETAESIRRAKQQADSTQTFYEKPNKLLPTVASSIVQSNAINTGRSSLPIILSNTERPSRINASPLDKRALGHFPLFISRPQPTILKSYPFSAIRNDMISDPLFPSLMARASSKNFGMPFRIQTRRKRELYRLPQARKYRIFSAIPDSSLPLSSGESSNTQPMDMIPSQDDSQEFTRNSEGRLLIKQGNAQHRIRTAQPNTRGGGKLTTNGYSYNSLNAYRPTSTTNAPPKIYAQDPEERLRQSRGGEDDGSLLNLLNSLNPLGDDFSMRKRPEDENEENTSETPSTEKPKYGILGSGNFEIIRGGIYKEDTTETPSSQDSEESGNSRRGKVIKKKSKITKERAGTTQEPPTNNIDNQFLLNNIPLLGFQGFDNFARASSNKPKRRNFVHSV